MENMKISIIVPVYNIKKYIKECVDSLLAQTYTNLEIILVDDGSTDNCPAICDEYAEKDQRIKVIHQKNGGLSAARNAGLDIVTGFLLSYVDGDDYINEQFYETLVCEMLRTNADIVECYSNNFVDGDDPDWRETVQITNRKLLTKNEWHTETHLGEFISCAVWNKLYKTSLYGGIRFPVGRVYEDEATTFKVVDKANKVARIDAKLYYYRQRPGSIVMGSLTLKKIEDKLLAFQEKTEYFKYAGNMDVELFARAKLCLAAISVVNVSKELDSTGNVQKTLIATIKENYQKIKNARNVPFQYRIYIRLFLLWKKFCSGKKDNWKTV